MKTAVEITFMNHNCNNNNLRDKNIVSIVNNNEL